MELRALRQSWGSPAGARRARASQLRAKRTTDKCSLVSLSPRAKRSVVLACLIRCAAHHLRWLPPPRSFCTTCRLGVAPSMSRKPRRPAKPGSAAGTQPPTRLLVGAAFIVLIAVATASFLRGRRSGEQLTASSSPTSPDVERAAAAFAAALRGECSTGIIEIDLREVDQDDTHWLQHRVGFPVGLRCPVVLRGVVDWSGVSGAALRTRASAVATVLSRAALPHRPPSWHVSGRGSG